MTDNKAKLNRTWSEFLGKEMISDIVFLPFESSRKFAQGLKLKNLRDWREYCRSGNKPNNIPKYPDSAYKDKGWIGIGDWLGTGKLRASKKDLFPFEEARKFIQKLNLGSKADWFEYRKSGKKPHNIPTNPNIGYKDKGWVSWGDFLGTGNKKGGWLSFQSARCFIHTLNLKNQKCWIKYCKSGEKPNNIPSMPDRTYKDKGWTNLADWLGY
jgi:hypothetical protein